MTPKKKHIIVKSFVEQKETHRITCNDGRVIDLFIGRKYGENSREINPVVCEVLNIGEGVEQVEIGDVLIVHHNMLNNDAAMIEKNSIENSVTLSLPADNMIYAKINKLTGELFPLFGSCIAERINTTGSSIIIAPDEKTEETKFKILATPPNYDDVKPDDVVLCYKLSDYEMVYHFNGSERRAIRILTDDILAVYTEA
jgi:hypothetical protein